MEWDKELKLLEDFPPPSYEEWRKAVEATLKGADFDKVMYTKTYEDITLEPIYRREDLSKIPFFDSVPGKSPFVRGNNPEKFLSEGWLIAQSHRESDLKALNAQILRELQLGLTAVNLQLKHDDDLRGVAIKSIDDLRAICAAIDLRAAPLFMQLDIDDSPLILLLEQYIQERGYAWDELQLGVGFDPVSELARKGYLSASWDESWERIEESVEIALKNISGLRCLSLNGNVYSNAGASSTQELGIILATAIFYLQNLLDKGWSLEQLSPLFQIKLALGPNFFMEIAKVRAMRLLWAEMIKAFGGKEEAQKVWIHGKTATFNQSLYDVYVNLLRNATEAFSGVIGGIDSLEVGRFNELTSEEEEFSRRLARNQQIILKEESHFDKVVDPAGGSYYIENLTQEIALQAWKYMQELESEGGVLKALQKGNIHSDIEKVAYARNEAMRKRKDIYVGVNLYANPDENPPTRVQIPTESHLTKKEILNAGALPHYRALEEMENLRTRVLQSGKNTKIFLMNMGTINDYRVRAEFATGFFQAGGFTVISPSGFMQVEDAIKSAQESNAAAYCICSTDEKYDELIPQITSALSDSFLILAGYPKDKVESFKSQGIKMFIYMGADIVTTLDELAEKLGVENEA
jgi:methylmalonyl-CoA mutase